MRRSGCASWQLREQAIRYGLSDRQTIATEMRQLSEQLASVANITDSNGDYLFSGFQASVKPFVLDEQGVIQFNGDSGRREIEICKGSSYGEFEQWRRDLYASALTRWTGKPVDL